MTNYLHIGCASVVHGNGSRGVVLEKFSLTVAAGLCYSIEGVPYA
jgi:hypothetical protein